MAKRQQTFQRAARKRKAKQHAKKVKAEIQERSAKETQSEKASS